MYVENLNAEDAHLARKLQQMWPHREHESGALRALMCRLGMHLWLQPDYSGSAPHRSVRFCLWCPCVKIDRRIYR